MPAKMNKNKKRRSRNRNGDRPSGNPLTLWLGSPTKEVIRRVVYIQTGAFSESASAAGGYYTFSLNGVYDPDVTGTGKQPIGFDQLSAMYYSFRVIKADVAVSFINNTTTHGIVAGCYAGYTGFLPSDPDSWEVQRNARTLHLAPSTVAGCKGMIRTRYMPNEVLGVTKKVYESDMDYVGNSSMNPPRQAYLQLFLRTTPGAGATGAANYYIRIGYTVICSNPVALPMS